MTMSTTSRAALLASGFLLAASGPGSAQQQATSPQGQIMYACPPGYVCSPSPQPGNMPPRQLTQQELDTVRGAVVRDAAGAILTPGEVQDLRDRGINAQSAANWPGLSRDTLPEAEPRVIQIADASKRVPDKITLAIGVVTPITFLDKRGKPWPIASVAYDPRTFSQDGNGCGNNQQQAPAALTGERPTTITLMPCRYQTFGNISVSLEGLGTPIVLLAQSGFGTGKMDLPVTVRLTGASPETVAQARIDESERKSRALIRAYNTVPAVPPGVDPELDSFLTGVPPKGAQPVRTDMREVSAWLYNGRLYLRGPVTVINPAYDAMGAGTNGQFIWRFNTPMARVRVVLDGGEERPVTIGL